jgi:uncharacterized protein YprB with RNaseH-like and TPR domain
MSKLFTNTNRKVKNAQPYNTNTFKFHGLSLVPMNNLLINEANHESNESVVSQHSGISKAKLVYWDVETLGFAEGNRRTRRKTLVARPAVTHRLVPPGP